ncbi:DinB family protein [Salegentibacter chungangensis]|uniref:DinB family protein n=1 Tax=Salegentibacter chungangensis TaxID=1335724 RepID=A0ABW3NT20_9FLAO
MKKLALPLVMLLLLSFSTSSLKLTDEEREKAINELTESREELLSTLDGVSDEQLNFKPDESTWSLAEITEHLAIAENAISGMVQQSLQAPVDEASPKEASVTDEQILQIIRDRSKKVKTQEPLEPKDKFGSFEESLEAFKQKRQENIDYVKTTDDDLREHFTKLPFGSVDAYQLILFMSGHTQRHIAQMEEVMDNENFPED